MIITWFPFPDPMTWASRTLERGITHSLVKKQLYAYLLESTGLYNKSCRFCDGAKAMGKKTKAHDCQKNHEASSKAMEPATAVELFNK